MVRLQSCVLPLLALVTPSAGTGTCDVWDCSSCEAGEPTKCEVCDAGFRLQTGYQDYYGNQPHCEFDVSPECEVYYCDTCVEGNSKKCAQCTHDYELVANTDGWTGHENACEYQVCSDLTSEGADAYFAEFLSGNIFGALICMVTVVVTSLPVCCGFGKEMPHLILVAFSCMVFAGFGMGISLATGKMAMDRIVEDACDACGCTEQERSDLKDALSALEVVFAYTIGGGFVVIILFLITQILGCCMCCPCCGPLKEMKKEAAARREELRTVVDKVLGNPMC